MAGIQWIAPRYKFGPVEIFRIHDTCLYARLFPHLQVIFTAQVHSGKRWRLGDWWRKRIGNCLC